MMPNKRGSENRRIIAESLEEPTWKEIKKETEKDFEKKDFLENQKIYTQLLSKYKSLTREILKIQKKDGPDNSSYAKSACLVIDRERQEVHKELNKLSKKIYKNEHDVLVDIVRTENSLEHYDLPELSILTSNDIINTNDWYTPYQINIDTRSKKPNQQVGYTAYENEEGAELTKREKSRKSKQNLYSRDRYSSPSEHEIIILPNEVMIVYDISEITANATKVLVPENHKKREIAAKNLANSIDGNFIHMQDSGFHEAYVDLMGVIIKNEDLEKTLHLIKSNPEKFRFQD